MLRLKYQVANKLTAGSCQSAATFLLKTCRRRGRKQDRSNGIWSLLLIRKKSIIHVTDIPVIMCVGINVVRVIDLYAVSLLQEVLNTSETGVNLTKLTPFTNYIISVSCIVSEAAHGYWSDQRYISAQTAEYGWLYNFVLVIIIIIFV